MRRVFFLGMILLTLVGCGGSGANTNAGVPAPAATDQPPPFAAAQSPTLVAITVWPPDARTAIGSGEQLSATGTFSDNSTRDITDQVTWRSSSSAVATISSEGLASGVTTGQVTLTASQGAVSQTSTLTVSNATLQSIQVLPATATIANGTSIQLNATGIYSDFSTEDLTGQVAWSASSPALGIDAQGMARGQSPADNLTITATFRGVSGSASITVTSATLVSLDIDSPLTQIAVGTPQTYSAFGTFSDDSVQDITADVHWNASSGELTSARAALGPDAGTRAGVEVVTLDTAGDATVSASLNGVAGNTQLMSSSATLQSITVTPATSTIAQGTTVKFTAIGNFSDQTTQDLTNAVTWLSSDGVVMSNAAGSAGTAFGLNLASNVQVVALYKGIVGTARLSVVKALLKSIAVSTSNDMHPVGLESPLTAIGTYTDGSTQDLTTQAAWSSSAPLDAAVEVRQVTDFGQRRPRTVVVVTGLRVGTPGITASFGGITGTMPYNVSAEQLLEVIVHAPTGRISLRREVELRASAVYLGLDLIDITNQGNVTWEAENRRPGQGFTVSNIPGQKGVVQALGPNDATIRVRFQGVTGKGFVNTF